MTAPDLLARWLTALRASTRLATGRECDYARAEGDADTFDAIGLLALAAGDEPFEDDDPSVTGWIFRRGADGAYYNRHDAERLAILVGLAPIDLITLAELNDAGWTGSYLAAWVDARVHEAHTRG